jgi:putative SOS response-associated peptidase YedK
MRGLKFTIPEHPRYNIAPTQAIPVVLNDGKRELTYAHWGLIPSWSNDPSIASRMINARAESLAEKPSFRTSLRRRRCLIWADGFYEWATIPGRPRKVPVRVTLKSEEPFAFAGLWDVWHSPGGDEILSATIITTAPNSLMARFHHRMPVILPSEDYDPWLVEEEVTPESVLPILKQYPAELMTARPVSYAVNSATVNNPSCLDPFPEPIDLDLFK